MRLNSKKILGISITTSSRKEILEEIKKYLVGNLRTNDQNAKKQVKPLVIVTPNPEQVVYAKKDSHFADILNRADVALPDGIGITIAARYLNIFSKSYTLRPIPGVEFVENLVAVATERGVTIGLIGGRGAVAVEALECLQKMHPKLQGWAEDGPEVRLACRPPAGPLRSSEASEAGQAGITNYELRIMNHREEKIQDSSFKIQASSTEDYFKQLTRRITESHTSIIFIGLGAPKQEYFIERLTYHVSRISYHLPLVLMSVGGSFDEISGRSQRPPKIVLRYGLKWLWRLILEPRRFRRQLALLEFIRMVLAEKLRGSPQS